MQMGQTKLQEWEQFGQSLERLRKGGKRALTKLSDSELTRLIDSYQALTADLARARSLNAPPSTVRYLNRLAVTAHSLIYGYSRAKEPINFRAGYDAFARAVRSVPGAVLLAHLCFWVPAAICFFLVQVDATLAYQLVPPGFYGFEPTSEAHMHEIPQLTRPVVASSIIANNVQVTFLAFALGLSAGLGTALLLIYNGVHIGAVAGWMTYQGKGAALWGWILPHGSTELIAICLAGAAGFVMGEAIWAPGLSTRVKALQRAGLLALKIELGCMVMLLMAGLIEGYVSPSSINFSARVVILVASLALWAAYFWRAGRENS